MRDSTLLGGFENALVSTVVANAHTELEQPRNIQEDRLRDHLHRLQSSIDQSLLTPENKLHLDNALQKLLLESDHAPGTD